MGRILKAAAPTTSDMEPELQCIFRLQLLFTFNHR